MRLIIFLWPALFPLLLYLIWLVAARKRAKSKGDVLPGLKDGPWSRIVIATLIIMALCFLFMGLIEKADDGVYRPAEYKDGKLVPGSIGDER